MAELHGGHVVDDKEVRVTSVLQAQHEHAVVSEDATEDENVLAALGAEPSRER